jgi:hypothetical protein
MDTHTQFSNGSENNNSVAGPGARGLELLRLAAEERAIRLDLAARLLQMKPSALVPVVERLVRGGLLEQDRFLVKERYPWIWPSRSGLRAAGTGYAFYEPRPGQLQHLAGVAATRSVCVEANPGALWVPERALVREHNRCRRHLADGALQLGGRRIPIEVELTPKDRQKLVVIMGSLLKDYGTAQYYCSERTSAAVKAVVSAEGFTEVKVFDVPVV